MSPLRELLSYGTHEDFAKKVGCSRTYLSRICHGHVRPSFELALRISAATNGRVSIETLMNPDMPFPVTARLRDCDPVLTSHQLVDLERKQLALLGYTEPLDDDDPPPQAPAGRPPPDPRQMDIDDYLPEQTSNAAGGRQRRVRTA